MSNLFLIQSNFASTPQAIAKLKSIYQHNDQIVLMGDAVQFVMDEFLQQLKIIYVIHTDIDILIKLDTENVEVIEYNRFADICLQHTCCISLK